MDEQAAQCGYCIAGMMMRAQALLQSKPDPADSEIRAALEPNLCRCGTHMRILRAVRRAAGPDADCRRRLRWERAMNGAAVISRRRVLAGTGALIVSFSTRRLLGARGARSGQATPAKPPLPGSLKENPFLNSWIRMEADGNITVFTGKAELGQGIKTALLQVAAEQLDVPMAALKIVTADTSRTANEGFTAGSHSMQDSGTAIMHAAAQVRAILLAEAARRLGLPAGRAQDSRAAR